MPVGSLDYIPARSVVYNTTPSLSPSGNSTHMAETAAIREALQVGTRITVHPGVPNLERKMGTIVGTGSLPDGDCSVLLDGWEHPIGFYIDEFSISRRPTPTVLPL